MKKNFKKNDNKLFHINEKAFKRNLNKNNEKLTNNNIEIPAVHDLEDSWQVSEGQKDVIMGKQNR